MANEKRLIDANAIPYEEHYVPDGDVMWEYKKELCVLKPTIDAMPTVDAVEVVHGRWISLTNCANAGVYCSVCYKNVYKEDYAWCNRKNKLRSNYCPNCGAKMDGDGNV